jgi:hypothetical protein
MTQSTINVTISSYQAANQGKTAYIGLAADGISLILKSAPDNTTTWTLIPNVAAGAKTGGFTLYNTGGTGGNQAASIPATGNQITLNDDPTPYGTPSYCWTLWSTNPWQGVQLWCIQDDQQGGLMDAENGGTDPGTRILLWGSGVGDNQQWIITAV